MTRHHLRAWKHCEKIHRQVPRRHGSSYFIYLYLIEIYGNIHIQLNIVYFQLWQYHCKHFWNFSFRASVRYFIRHKHYNFHYFLITYRILFKSKYFWIFSCHEYQWLCRIFHFCIFSVMFHFFWMKKNGSLTAYYRKLGYSIQYFILYF